MGIVDVTQDYHRNAFLILQATDYNKNNLQT